MVDAGHENARRCLWTASACGRAFDPAISPASAGAKRKFRAGSPTSAQTSPSTRAERPRSIDSCVWIDQSSISFMKRSFRRYARSVSSVNSKVSWGGGASRGAAIPAAMRHDWLVRPRHGIRISNQSRRSGDVIPRDSDERLCVAVCGEGAFREEALPFGVQHLTCRHIQRA